MRATVLASKRSHLASTMASSSTALTSAGCLLVATLGWLWRRSEAEARRLARRVALLEAESTNQQPAPQVLQRAAGDAPKAEVTAAQQTVAVTLQGPINESTAGELVLVRAEAAALAAQLEQLEEANVLRAARTLELEEANEQLEAQLATATGARTAALEHERQGRKERAEARTELAQAPAQASPNPSPGPSPSCNLVPAQSLTLALALALTRCATHSSRASRPRSRRAVGSSAPARPRRRRPRSRMKRCWRRDGSSSRWRG